MTPTDPILSPTAPPGVDKAENVGQQRHDKVTGARMTAVSGRETAAVIGGGLAGMLTALVLSEWCDVWIFERDLYPAEPGFRPGQPQAPHAHLFLEAGHQGLEALMPGIRAELLAAGAVSVVMGQQLRWLTSAGQMARHPGPTSFLSITRALLDQIVRARVLSRPSIQVFEGAKVVGLLGTARAVTGVRIRERGQTSVVDVPAELVVDASGRYSKVAREWLPALGAPSVPEKNIDAGCVYSSRLVHRPAGLDDLGYSALYVQTTPDQPVTGSCLPVEGDLWICSLGGMRGYQPSAGEAGFDALLAQVRDPVLREIVREAEPASEVELFPAGPSYWRHFERNGPAGLVSLADARNVGNPAYGHGMTLAVKGVQALGAEVKRHGCIGHAVARAANRAINAVYRYPWMMSSAEDSRFRATIGAPTGPMVRAQHWSVGRILERATEDPPVAAAFTRVMSLVDSPITAFGRPDVLASVLFGFGGGRG